MTMPPVIVYLLCFDRELDSRRHYIGMCGEHRYQQRMREHQTGNGGRTTRRWINQGIGFEVARTWQVWDAKFERKLKASGHFERLCPRCRPHLGGQSSVCYLNHFPADPPKPLGGEGAWPADQPATPPQKLKRPGQ